MRYLEALALTTELGERQLASRTIDRLGVALYFSGKRRQAARLLGSAAALRESLGDALFAEEEADPTEQIQTIRTELGEPVYVALWESGRSLPFERASAEANALAE